MFSFYYHFKYRTFLTVFWVYVITFYFYNKTWAFAQFTDYALNTINCLNILSIIKATKKALN